MAQTSNRRDALKCLGVGAGTLFTMSGGVLSASNLAEAQEDMGQPLFLQISDTHIGFNKDANPDVVGTLNHTIDLVNAMPKMPSFVLHTGDVSHLSKASEFETASQLLSRLKVSELHLVPGEHDVTDGTGAQFFGRFGKPSNNRGYYSFDVHGVHFIALVNVMNFKANGLGGLGDDQMAWFKDDLAGRSSSQPIVVFAHIPLWTVYEPWGWGTGETDQIVALLRRFGSVTILNGHIHQIVQKQDGNILFHTARSTAYPQPQAGSGPGPGPLVVPVDQLPGMLGATVGAQRSRKLSLTDITLA